MVSKMGKAGMMGKGSAAQQKQMAALRKNPNQMMQRINQMDPRMLQQMGGAANVQKMVQSMSGGGGGMPDMETMMQQMGGGGLGGSMPPGMMPGMGGSQGAGMPDMATLQQMMASMGGGWYGRTTPTAPVDEIGAR